MYETLYNNLIYKSKYRILFGLWDHNPKARNLVRKAFNNDGKLASATKLADARTNEMTNQWAQDNKAQFDEEYDKANPLSDNATKSDVLAHNKY